MAGRKEGKAYWASGLLQSLLPFWKKKKEGEGPTRKGASRQGEKKGSRANKRGRSVAA